MTFYDKACLWLVAAFSVFRAGSGVTKSVEVTVTHCCRSIPHARSAASCLAQETDTGQKVQGIDNLDK